MNLHVMFVYYCGIRKGIIDKLDEVRMGKKVILLDIAIRYCCVQILMCKAPDLAKRTLQCSSINVRNSEMEKWEEE